MTDDIDWEIIDRYFSGGSTAEEAARIEQWAEHDASRAVQLAAVRRLWEEAGVVPQRFDAEAALQNARRLRERPLELHVSRQARPPRPSLALARPARRFRTMSFAAAAALLLAATLAIGARLRYATNVTAPATSIREYATARGQRAEVRLADGTRVMLNVRSRLRVPVTFGSDGRDVYLEGEAFFEVAHDSKLPFRVHATGALAEDLGTAFLVRAYPEDSSATVVVTQGRVALRASDEDASRGVALAPRQLGRFDRSRLVTVMSDVDVDRYLAWRDDRLVFHQTPLAQVARELERWFDVDITLADSSLAATPITGTFAHQSPDAALGDIARLLDARYVRQGTHVVLYPPGSTR